MGNVIGMAGLLCEIVKNGFGRFNELIVYDKARVIVDDADSRKLLTVLR